MGYAVSAYPLPQWCRVLLHLHRTLQGVLKRYIPLRVVAKHEAQVTMGDDGDDVLTPPYFIVTTVTIVTFATSA